MMKDVTILTFDEMERIRNDLDRMIDTAREGAVGINSQNNCDWVLEDLIEFRKQFE